MSWFGFGKKEEKKEEVPSGYLEKCLKRIEEAATVEKVSGMGPAIYKVTGFAVARHGAYFRGIAVPLSSSEQAKVYGAIVEKYHIQENAKATAILKEF